jgi:anaphase-promoting complex subunit 2
LRGSRLQFFLRQALGSLRIGELFDLIVDFPDSMPAILDLRECLSHTQQHADAVRALSAAIEARLHACAHHGAPSSPQVRALSAAIEARLLLPGVDTANIIQVYVSTIHAGACTRGVHAHAHHGAPRPHRYVSAIKALSCLDPSGVKLEAVSERVRAYLKARPDTIRQIVTSLTDPETSELLENTGSEAELLTDDGGADGSLYDAADAEEAKADEATMLAWQPDPIQADPTRPSARRNADVLSRLVNIYGSRALFVNEFRNMLADKLLTASDYDTDREVRMPRRLPDAHRLPRVAAECLRCRLPHPQVRNLELLKKRF